MKLEFEFGNNDELEINDIDFSCEAVYGFAVGATPTCVSDTDLGLITLSGVFPTQEDLLILNLYGVFNPKYVTLRTIQIQSYADSDATNLIENSGLSSFSY